MTNDIDVVAQLRLEHVEPSLASFPNPELYFKDGGSEKHLRDIVGILKVQGELIDHAYLTEWIPRLGVADPWQLVQSRLTPPKVDGA